MKRTRSKVAKPQKRARLREGFTIKEIGVNSKKGTGTVSTFYSKTWKGVTDAQLIHILQTIKRMETGGWVTESSVEAVDNPNVVELNWRDILNRPRSNMILGPGLNTVTWTYKVIR